MHVCVVTAHAHGLWPRPDIYRIYYVRARFKPGGAPGCYDAGGNTVIPLYLSVPPVYSSMPLFPSLPLSPSLFLSIPLSHCLPLYPSVSACIPFKHYYKSMIAGACDSKCSVPLCSTCIQLYAPLPLSPSVSLSFPLYPPLSLCLPLYPSVSACIPFKHYYKSMIAGACDSKCSISGYQLLSIYEKVRLNLSNVDIFLTFCHVTRIYS